MRGATLNTSSQPFGRTTANLASGSACRTARLLQQRRFYSPPLHRHRPIRFNLHQLELCADVVQSIFDR